MKKIIIFICFICCSVSVFAKIFLLPKDTKRYEDLQEVLYFTDLESVFYCDTKEEVLNLTRKHGVKYVKPMPMDRTGGYDDEISNSNYKFGVSFFKEFFDYDSGEYIRGFVYEFDYDNNLIYCYFIVKSRLYNDLE